MVSDLLNINAGESNTSPAPESVVKELSKALKEQIFPNSSINGSSFKSNSELTRSLCENGEALDQKSVDTVLAKHLKALKGFNGASWQTLDVSGMVMAILPGSSKDLASFSNKKISEDTDLSGKDLRYCNFCSSLAENVEFDNSDLSDAIFTDSFMQGVSFKNCKMTNVDFSRADLRNVSFENASLDNCDFENANLEGADFTNTMDLSYATFPGANLKGVKI